MYSVKLTEDLYFSGNYASIGTVQGGINVPSLPPTDNSEKALFYKYDYHDVVTIVQVPVMEEVIVQTPVIDEVTGVQKVDEQGQPVYTETTTTQPKVDEDGVQVYEDREITNSVLEWVFDEDKYNTYLEEKSNEAIEPTTDEKFTVLQTENELLKGCIMELASVLYA